MGPDPAADLAVPRVPRGLPKALAEDEVEAAARLGGRRRRRRPAGPGDPRGALRDRAAHLRAGRPVARRRRPRRRAAAGLRQGVEGADRPGRAVRGRCPGPVAGRRRPARAGPRAVGPARRRRGGVPQPPRRAAVPPGRVGRRAQGRGAGRARRPADPPRAAPLLRDPHARPRRRHPHRAGAARPRLDQHDAGVHAGVDRAAVVGVPRRPPEGDGRRAADPDRRSATVRGQSTPSAGGMGSVAP